MLASIALFQLGLAVPAIAAADKPLVMESAKVKQLPASTTLQVNASGTGAASINIPHGTAPSSPINGDCWTTTSSLACRINGATATLSGSNSGDQTITLTGNVTGSGTGSFATTIGANAVTRANLAATSGAVLLGATAAGNVADLTGTQATTLLDTFTSSLKGLAPASGGGTTNFLRADGSWAAPAGGGSSITTKDEGSTLTAATSSIDFVGAGVTATNSSGAVTVTVPGGAGTFRGALAYKSASANINASSVGVIVFDSESYDTDNFHSTTTNTSRLTIPAGVTKVRITACLTTNNILTNTQLFVFISKNGVQNWTGSGRNTFNPSAANISFPVATAVVTVTAGDYLWDPLESTCRHASLSIL